MEILAQLTLVKLDKFFSKGNSFNFFIAKFAQVKFTAKFLLTTSPQANCS